MSETDKHENYLSPPERVGNTHDIVCREFDEDVSIRARDNGVMMYAVYDGEEQISAEVGPLNDRDVIAFAEGYALRKSEES